MRSTRTYYYVNFATSHNEKNAKLPSMKTFKKPLGYNKLLLFYNESRNYSAMLSPLLQYNVDVMFPVICT